MKFHHILLAGVAAAAMTSAAQAADLIIDQPPVYSAPVVASHDWSGLYLGISGGLGTGTFDWSGDYDDDDDTYEGEFDLEGWALGAQAGVNFQSGMFVYGLEADVNWTDISGSGLVFEGEPDGPTAALDLDWMGSIRGRAGVAFDQALLYGTAGFAFGGGDLTITDLDGGGTLPGDRTSSTNLYGWTAGAGAEFAITENVSIRGEYAYTSLVSNDVEFVDVEPDDGDLSVEGTAGIHTVKAGLNFAF